MVRGALPLQIYAAAILGGAVAGLYGRSVWGPLLASLILTATVNLMIPLRIPAWTGPGLDALWLLAGCIAWRLGTSNPKQARTGDGSIRGARSWAFALTAAGALGVVALDPGLSSVGETLIYALVLSLLALGQSACIRARGFDLSMPSMTAAAGFIGMTLLQGADAALLRVTLIIAGLGIAAGLSNALAIASGVPAVFATLATAGVLQVASGGVAVTSPMGFAPASLTWAMTGRLAGLPPALFLLVPCVAALTFALNRFLERPRSKPIGPTIVLYVASGVLSAASGLLLAAYGGGVTRPYQIEVYFLPTMAALTIAGIMIGGAQRSLSAVPPAVFCIVVFDTFLVRLGLDYGSRIVVLGGLLLGGTLVLRSIESMRLASDERGV
jgi:ribose/xylose/arabinose/galactoside ABC-type transport system permease subunit